MATKKAPSRIHSLSQLTPGTKLEHRLSGQHVVVTANQGKQVTAADNVVIVVVNDHAHKEWICSTSELPLNKLKVGDIISRDYSYVITFISDFILSATRTVIITNPDEYYLID